MDVLGIVQDLGWREERSVAGRRAFPDVKSYLLVARVAGDAPLVFSNGRPLCGAPAPATHLLHRSLGNLLLLFRGAFKRILTT